MEVVQFRPSFPSFFRGNNGYMAGIAMYGNPNNLKTSKDWVNGIIEIFNHFKIDPKLGAVINYYTGQKKYPDNQLPYKSLLKILQKNNYEDINSFILSDFDKDTKREKLYVNTTINIKGRINDFFIIYDPRHVDNKILISILRKISIDYELFYGFKYKGYNRSKMISYLNGSIQFNFLKFWKDREEALAQKWTELDSMSLEGYLRNVYEENYLSLIHLNKEIKPGRTLKEYILSNPQNGTLEGFTSDIYLWKVAEENLKNVRNELYKTSDIIICNPHTI